MRRAYEREGRATSAVDRLAASPVLIFSCKLQVNKRSATAIPVPHRPRRLNPPCMPGRPEVERGLSR